MNLYVIPVSEIKNKYIHFTEKKLFLIPYEIETNFVKFAPITMEQYFSLKRNFGKGKKLLKKTLYQSILDLFVDENKQVVLKIFIMLHIHNTRENVICLCRNKFLLPKEVKLFEEHFKCLYVLPCTRNPSDFELPMHLICLLRSYPWPFYNKLNGTLINLFNKTFPGKGLKRKCTHYEGCFEMIGERNSKQSTGILLVLPEKVDEH